MVHVQDIAKEEDYSPDDIEDSSDDYSDDTDDTDDSHDDLELEVDSNGEYIASEDNTIKSYLTACKTTKYFIGRVEQCLKSGAPETLVIEQTTSHLAVIEGTFKLAGDQLSLLLSTGSQGPKMETILQMHDHFTTAVSAIKAKVAALG